MPTKRVTTPEKVLSWHVDVQVTHAVEVTQREVDEARFDNPKKFKGWTDKAIIKEIVGGMLIKTGEYDREIVNILPSDIEPERTAIVKY